MTEGTLARIRAILDEERRVHLELHNGRIAFVEMPDDHGLAVGDVVLIVDTDRGQRLERVPRVLWPEEPWIGIVRLKHDDVTVISDPGGRLRRVPTSMVEYTENNTVEVDDLVGVHRVLSEQPLRYLDGPGLDDAAIGRFRYVATGDGPTFADFGGLESVVRRAKELVELPLIRRAELSAIGAKPIKGVLFTGPPGTGKTLLARIIAAQTDAAFFDVRGPEIFSKWYGQSGEVLRRIFASAAEQERAIVFFDEIDSIAPRRGGDSHEETRRVVAQLLALMDGFEPDQHVVVIATTNRPDDIDPALRRPGRFDWEIRFPMPELDDRERILQVSAAKLATADALPHRAMAVRTAGWSGADLAAIWNEAALLAAKDRRQSITLEDYVGGFQRVNSQRADKLQSSREVSQ